MDRIGRLSETAAFGFTLLLLLGCEPAAQSRSAPLLSTPTTPPKLAAGGDLPAQARQIVIDGLGDPSPQIRANAVEVVATTRDIRLMPRVQKLLADEVVPVRFAAAVAVGDMEYALAKKDIAGLLSDPNPNMKIAAAYAFSRLGEPEYYKVLSSSLASNDQTVRANAALLLGKSGRQEGVGYLYWTLQRADSADKVVLQAAESIAMLKDPRIYPKLWTRLISAYADDRVIGIQAMGALGTEEARNALVTMLDDAVPEVRLAAAGQLGRLGDAIGEPEVLAVIEKNLSAAMDPQGQERIRTLTALAIGEIGTPSLTRHLPSLLRDPSKVVRLAAAKAVLRSAARGIGS
ncbi:MAG: HEAT repeat domain-containing protein [Sedimentisphaerales bacterium]|nr:HEAT repeat domain-containing protein [Sedimentisphaerales bacterium]